MDYLLVFCQISLPHHVPPTPLCTPPLISYAYPYPPPPSPTEVIFSLSPPGSSRLLHHAATVRGQEYSSTSSAWIVRGWARGCSTVQFVVNEMDMETPSRNIKVNVEKGTASHSVIVVAGEGSRTPSLEICWWGQLSGYQGHCPGDRQDSQEVCKSGASGGCENNCMSSFC